jgi:glutathione peroxidase
MRTNLYNFSATTNKGEDLNLSSLEGKAVLIVNTASKCGFTPQYEGLQKIHEIYGPQGLVVLGFPCDQFAHQEPGTDSDIEQFCSINYGVTFQLMRKIDVNGKDAHPLFVWLKKQAPGTLGTAVKWNFTKFLVSKDGTEVKRFAPTVEPDKMHKDIEKFL